MVVDCSSSLECIRCIWSHYGSIFGAVMVLHLGSFWQYTWGDSGSIPRGFVAVYLWSDYWTCGSECDINTVSYMNTVLGSTIDHAPQLIGVSAKALSTVSQ